MGNPNSGHRTAPGVGTARDISLQEGARVWPGAGNRARHCRGMGGQDHGGGLGEATCTHNMAEGPDLSLDGSLGRAVRLDGAIEAC